MGSILKIPPLDRFWSNVVLPKHWHYVSLNSMLTVSIHQTPRSPKLCRPLSDFMYIFIASRVRIIPIDLIFLSAVR